MEIVKYRVMEVFKDGEQDCFEIQRGCNFFGLYTHWTHYSYHLFLDDAIDELHSLIRKPKITKVVVESQE